MKGDLLGAGRVFRRDVLRCEEETVFHPIQVDAQVDIELVLGLHEGAKSAAA